jgi:hypothetical protein
MSAALVAQGFLLVLRFLHFIAVFNNYYSRGDFTVIYASVSN